MFKCGKKAKKCGTALLLNSKKCGEVRQKKAKSAACVRQKMTKSAVMCGQKLKIVRLSAVFSLQPWHISTYLADILISFNVLDCHLIILMD